ncbi:MAG: hypothetical protein U5R30_21230 [Deltaproteobacteria bacterium]|nr:hypothetical protein [Deltaproteobacteria bacterium]
MARRKKPPELTFQEHIADFLVRVHGYGVLEQGEITDTDHCMAEDQLWAFLRATQADTLQKLADDYGTDARDEVFKRPAQGTGAHAAVDDFAPRPQGARAGIPPLLSQAPLGRKRRGSQARGKPHHLPARISISARPTRRSISSFSSTACPSWRWR